MAELTELEKVLALRVAGLCKALRQVLIKDGVLNADTMPTGEELLMAAGEYCK